MFETAIKNVRYFFHAIKDAALQRRRRKLAQQAEMDERERQALVTELRKKFAAAHADCQVKKKTFTTIEFSLKEIVFVEGYLESWSRHFREREIYRLRPANNV